MFLEKFPPMGVYETLFKFQDATGTYMGEPGTHPWAQGFPLTKRLPSGPELPPSVEFTPADLKYPTATGTDPLRKAIADYYNHFYGAKLTPENVAVFAGGRPAIFATLMFLRRDVKILIEETEYTPYYDKLKLLQRNYALIPSHPGNNFRPTLDDYKAAQGTGAVMVVKSNPCNPTGVTWTGQALADLVGYASSETTGAIFDEAYEFFHATAPVSALAFIRDIDSTNIFVVGAATKGLQVPGMRTGWVIASKAHIELFRNFSSIAMGGVSRPSQIYVTKLLQLDRVKQARAAVVDFYRRQRDVYRDGLLGCGVELCTGDGGFYHWGRLPRGMTADEFNVRLFRHKAAILPGQLCDMYRRGSSGPLGSYIRFSFGPIEPEAYDTNMSIIRDALVE